MIALFPSDRFFPRLRVCTESYAGCDRWTKRKTSCIFATWIILHLIEKTRGEPTWGVSFSQHLWLCLHLSYPAHVTDCVHLLRWLLSVNDPERLLRAEKAQNFKNYTKKHSKEDHYRYWIWARSAWQLIFLFNTLKNRARLYPNLYNSKWFTGHSREMSEIFVCIRRCTLQLHITTPKDYRFREV